MTCNDCEHFLTFPDGLSPSLRKKFMFVCESLLSKCHGPEEKVLEETLEEVEYFMTGTEATVYSFQNCKKLVNCLVHAGRSSRAIQLLEMRLANPNRDLHDDFHHLVELGKVYKKRGEYVIALSFYERAYDIAEVLDQHAQLALSLARMAVCYSNSENPEASLEYFKRSLEMIEFCHIEEQQSADHLMVSVYKEVAYLHGIIKADYRSSILYYEKALKIVQNGQNASTIKVCKLLSKISHCFSVVNDSQAVERYNSSVLFLTEDIKNSACVQIHVRALIEILSRSACSYGFVSLFNQEFDLNVKTLGLVRTHLGDSTPEVARIASGIFKQCHRLSKSEAEEKYYLAICEKSLKECGYKENAEKSKMYVRYVTDSLSNCATVFTRMRLYLRAEKYYKEALELNRNVFGELHPRNGRIMRMLARIHKRRGKRQLAKEMFQKCLHVYELCKPNHQIMIRSVKDELAKV